MTQMKNAYNSIKFILLVFMGIMILPVDAQSSSEMKIKGQVTTDGKSLSDVSVSVEGEFSFAFTDKSGNFAIRSEAGKTLLFTLNGYQIKKHLLSVDDSLIHISMIKMQEEKQYQVGYSQRRKSLLTAAISEVSGETLAKVPVATVNDALEGQVTGLTVQRTSGNEPGWSLSNYYIRGLGTFGSGRTPLVVIDGVERDITQLDAEEIESFTIQKDAAATANYGMRGANGVISIKTKRGFEGKPEITFKANVGFQTPSLLPEYLGSSEYVRFRNIALANDGLPVSTDPTADPSMYDGSQNPYIYPNTDWYEEFVRKSAPLQMYRLGVTGGSDIVKYYLTLGVTNQNGIYNYTDENKAFSTNPNYSRYNVRSNVDVNLTKDLMVSLDLAGKLETKRVPRVSASNIFSALSNLPPTMAIKNEDGSIAGTSVYQYNPYGYLARKGFEDQYSRYLQGNVSAVHKLDFLLKGLSAQAMFAFDTYKMYGRYKDQNYAVYQRNSDGTYTKFGEDSDLSLGYSSSDLGYTFQTTFTAGLDYANTFSDIHYVASDLKYLQSSYVQSGNYPNKKEQNIFGHITYAYNSRYVAEFGYAITGSENFVKENRYGFFPVASAAWVISKENFMQNASSIDFLKLRASYGLVGNSNIGIGRFPFSGQYYMGNGYVFGETPSSSDGAYEGRLRNMNITYEKSLNANVGLDVEVFEKLEVVFDLFRNYRYDIITTRELVLPSIIGQSLPYENIGSVLNRGFELALKYHDSHGDFSYFANANISFAKNKILEKEEPAGMESWTYAKGYSIDVQRGLEAVGFFNTQNDIDNWATSTYGLVKVGDIKYKDQNDDGFIDDNDIVPLDYSSIPEWNFGLNLGAAYKNFDLNVLFSAVANRTLIIYNNVFLGMAGNTNITATAYDTWQQGVNEATAKYPRLTTELVNHNLRNSTVWSHNGNYLRVQNIEIGYNLPSMLLTKVKMSSARIFINGYNLFSFDNLKKYNVSAAYPEAGISAYPEMKVYNVGLTVKF